MEELKKKIDSTFATRAEFAEAIGISPSRLSRMLQSGNWKAGMIEAAIKVLKIQPQDIPVYFFASGVANTATRET